MSRIVQVQLCRTQKTKLLKLIAIQRRCSCHDITVDNLNTSKVVEETELSVENHRRVTSH